MMNLSAMVSGKPEDTIDRSIGIVAITRNGVNLALQLQKMLPQSTCYVPMRHRFALAMGAEAFEKLPAVFPKVWSKHSAVACIMATGIVIRQIAPLIKHKTTDPAVVVLDEKGRFVISLLSGHLGGANELAQKIAQLIEGQAVITTASDVQGRPAIDLIARHAGLEIENSEMIARLTRSFLEHERIWIYDPYNCLRPYLKAEQNVTWLAGIECGRDPKLENGQSAYNRFTDDRDPKSSLPGIWVSEYTAPANEECLLLRPKNLVVGLGCNKGTSSDEMIALLRNVFAEAGLSLRSIRNLTSIDLKRDEPAILHTAKWLDRPIKFYSRKETQHISVPNPSELVATHIGVPSVCEATALLSSNNGKLIISKRKTANVTLAVARAGSLS
jgi:cobalt-precorrin 5A hydrolase